MKTMSIRLTTGLLVAAGLALTPLYATAQTPGSTVGVVGGWVTNEQVWRSEYETESVGGAQLGGFVNAATPVSWFQMRAEFMWTQRGGSVTGEINGNPLVGETRTDYLTVGVQPRAALRLGGLEVFGAAGPMLELVLRNRFNSELAVAVQEVGTVYGVGAGLGIAARINSTFRAEIEARVFEGLGDAYTGDFVSAKNRSFGVVARIGRPLRR
jgi:hypothetical protein